jgi:hypothetical protein
LVQYLILAEEQVHVFQSDTGFRHVGVLRARGARRETRRGRDKLAKGRTARLRGSANVCGNERASA